MATVTSSFIIWAMIDGRKLTNIAACTTMFAKNSLPTAGLSFSLGSMVGKTDTVENLELAQASEHVFKKLVAGEAMPVEIFLRKSTSDANGDFSVIEQKLFEGETAGHAWQRSGTSVSFRIAVRHWLEALNATPALSSAIHPASVNNLSRNAIESLFKIDSVNTATGVGGLASTTAIDTETAVWVGAKSLDSWRSAASNDLWDDGLLDYLTALAKAVPFAAQDAQLLARNQTGTDKILAALARMRRTTVATNTNTPIASLGKLKLRATTPAGTASYLNAQALGTAIGNSVNAMNGEAFANMTLWAKLIAQFRAEFLFDVIPRVNDALVIPSVCAYGGPVHAYITSNDQLSVDLTGMVEQPVRAVFLLHPTENLANGNMQSDPARVTGNDAFGAYLTEREGTTIVKLPPFWLGEAMQGIQTVSETATGGITTSLDEAPTVEQNAVAVPPGDARALRIDAMANVANAYAHEIYLNEALKSKMGTVVIPFNYSIAPGSTIAIQSPKEIRAMTGGDDQLDVYAHVVQTTHTIDATSQTAATNLTLSHCRTKIENNDDNYSTAIPTLYEAAWAGGELSPTTRIQ